MNVAELIDPVTYRLRPFAGPMFPEPIERYKLQAAHRLVSEARRGCLGMSIKVHEFDPAAYVPQPRAAKRTRNTDLSPARPKSASTRCKGGMGRICDYINAGTDPAGVSNQQISDALGLLRNKVSSACQQLYDRYHRIERTGKRGNFRYFPVR